MSEDKAKNLIGQLTEELTQIKPMQHPIRRMAPLMLISFAYVLIMITVIGPRADWMPKMYNEISYVFEFLLSFSIFLSAALTLGFLSVPDMRGQNWLKAVPMTLAAVFILWAALRVIYEWGEPLIFQWKNCSLDGLIMTIVPVFLLTISSRRGSTTQPIWSSAMTILSFSGLAWAGLRLTCSANTFAQSFVIHFLPFIIIGILFGLFAKRIFRW